jgi:hypothetical protein
LYGRSRPGQAPDTAEIESAHYPRQGGRAGLAVSV